MNERSSLIQKILSVLPDALATDVKDNVDAAVQGYFEQMNLVSRQEFEVQQKVLAKTRLKLEQLEEVLRELENKQV